MGMMDINKKTNRGKDGGRHGCRYLRHQISTATRAAAVTMAFCSKEEPTEERKESEGREQREPRGTSVSSQGGRVGGREARSAASITQIACRRCWETRVCC